MCCWARLHLATGLRLRKPPAKSCKTVEPVAKQFTAELPSSRLYSSNCPSLRSHRQAALRETPCLRQEQLVSWLACRDVKCKEFQIRPYVRELMNSTSCIIAHWLGSQTIVCHLRYSFLVRCFYMRPCAACLSNVHRLHTNDGHSTMAFGDKGL